MDGFVRYGNVFYYVENDPAKWAAFTARFSRTTYMVNELWDKEFRTIRENAPAPEAPCVQEQQRKKNKESKFIGKLLGYGDTSIMENATVCFFIENISILLSVLMTAPRYGWSLIERSTRRQKMYPHKGIGCDDWADYNAEFEKALQEIKCKNPTWSKEQVSDAACDATRGLVPLEAPSLMGFTCNARSFADLYHNLRPERFVGFNDDNDVFEEIIALKANLAAMFKNHYAPFYRKLDSSHDTFIADPAKMLVRTQFPLFSPYGNECTALTVRANFPTNFHFPLNVATLAGTLNHATGVDRHNRHCDVPVYFSTISVTGEIFSSFAIYREFVRHRLLECFDVRIDKRGSLLLKTRVRWLFTGTLGGLMRMMELRTEEKTHVDFQELAQTILAQLRTKKNDIGLPEDALASTFFFVENKK